ncbi:MAG: transcriptional repressor LexA [Candidatus Sericytochromatia bacterium]|nr:transcriptional repressor LexA [Candidatus Sericytochromatia bacterium]
MILPKRQQEVLDFLVAYIRDHGYAPSIEEIGDALGMRSTSTVAYHLDALTKKELIVRKGPRSFDVADSVQPVGVPMLGRITAGMPMLAQADHSEYVDVAKLFHLPNHFLLEVTGESMIDEQIRPGDMVLVEPAQQARNGDLVVALVDGEETTLKRYFLDGDQVRLQPSNATMDPILCDKVRVSVQGQVRALMRTYAPGRLR